MLNKFTERKRLFMKALGTEVLVTPRLILRKINKEDAESLFTVGILGKNLQDAINIVDSMLQSNDDPMSFHWALEYQGKAIGRIKGWEVDTHNNFVQLGYDIGIPYRGKGLMTEAVRAVSVYLLKKCEFNRVYCMVRESNPASNRVCEKAGMKHEGFLRNHWIQSDGTYTNVHCWGLLSSDI